MSPMRGEIVKTPMGGRPNRQRSPLRRNRSGLQESRERGRDQEGEEENPQGREGERREEVVANEEVATRERGERWERRGRKHHQENTWQPWACHVSR
jgi:hypothetical protein